MTNFFMLYFCWFIFVFVYLLLLGRLFSVVIVWFSYLCSFVVSFDSFFVCYILFVYLIIRIAYP